MARFTALDIANFFVQLSNDLPETDITNMKLNKMCYYAQGWSLARLGYPLFDDVIQAWEFGPVIPSVYHTYKVCGKAPIEAPSDEFDESLLTSDELSLLTDVYISYEKYSPSALVKMTHMPGSPWSKVYKERENNPITTDMMKDYFSASNELQTFQINLTEDNVVTYA